MPWIATSEENLKLNSQFYVETYTKHFRELVAQYGTDYAMELIVGGEYDAVGALEESALLNLGLRPEHTVVDVGCGTGRLSSRLAPFLKGKFVGTDVLPEALEYARKRANRPDWEFVVAAEPPLPVETGTADWVTFFSVFTHILDEHIYQYLEDAKRMLRPDGRIVFSFLDYDVPLHWQFFAGAVADKRPDRTMVRFLNRPAIEAWAMHLGLSLEYHYSGEVKWMQPMRGGEEAAWGDAQMFGKSIAVLAKAQS